jgi:hypothetical protein
LSGEAEPVPQPRRGLVERCRVEFDLRGQRPVLRYLEDLVTLER